jgi:hypothetical protein
MSAAKIIKNILYLYWTFSWDILFNFLAFLFPALVKSYKGVTKIRNDF